MGADWYTDCWKSREWRLNHLYWIERKVGAPVRFRMNWAQEELFRGLWTRNNVLKARQLGISTLTSLLILDGCLFRENWHAGIIDRTMDDAKEKLRKIKFALDALAQPPVNGEDRIEDAGDRAAINEFARQWHAAVKVRAKEERCSFSTGSWVKVGTSMRGGTLQFLHVSEFGSVAANNPKKAQEIITGGLNTVSPECVVVMESTHEGGKRGRNYELTRAAMEQAGKKLSMLDFRFFFFPWWRQREYRIESEEPLAMGARQREYFAALEEDEGIELDDAQKRWYMRQEELMGGSVRQEYPSTPAEAFETRVDGAIYGNIISRIRAKGQLNREFEADDNMPLYVSWDIGMADYMTMWLVQPGEDGRFYVLDCYAAHGLPLTHYVGRVRAWEQQHGQTVKANILPHDSAQRDKVEAIDFITHLRRQGMPCIQVPRVRDVWTGIDAVRKLLTHCVFHKRCAENRTVEGEEYMSGLNALENYRTAPTGALGRINDMPLHDSCSHYADAFRCFAEAFERGLVSRDGTAREQRGSGINGRRTARGVPW